MILRCILDTVTALPTVDNITGTDSVCIGDTVHLVNPSTGGIWTMSNASGTVDSGGVVTGITPGTDTVQYTITTICGSVSASLVMNIRSHSTCNVRVVPSPEVNYGINVYPNPNAGSFTVHLSSSDEEQVQVTITNILGEKVNEFIAKSNQDTVVSISASAGVYFILVHTKEGRYVSKVTVE